MRTNRTRRQLEAILATPWAILPETLSRIVELGRRAEAIDPREATSVLALSGDHGGATRLGGVSIIPIYGCIEHRQDWLMELFGEGASVDGISQALAAELADPNVSAVVLDIDSPGGTVAGVTELAAAIRAVRGGAKPIVAVADSLAASAAYWIGAQADEFVVSPSGAVGSIGVYCVHQEISRMLEIAGVATTIISAGPHKTEGNEFEPLTDAARLAIQERVDYAYDAFVSDVALGRRVTPAVVLEGYGGGAVLMPKPAKAAGMVDRIETLAATVARLTASAAPLRPGARARVALATGGEVVGALPPVVVVGESGPEAVEEPADVELVAAALARHKTATDHGPWDGAAAEANLPSGDGAEPALRKAHAWVDPAGDPNVKASYKFIHHEVAEGGAVGAANAMACSTGIGYLNRPPGAEGRPDIPDEDRQGTYDHMAGHMRDAGMEPPRFADAAAFTERVEALAAEAEALAAHAAERARLRAKENRPAFSTTTERALRTTRDALDRLLAAGEPPTEDDPTPAPDDPVAAEAPTITPAEPAPPRRRFRSDDDWLAYLQEN